MQLGSLPMLPLPAPPADKRVDDLKKDCDQRSLAVATHTKTIGIIYPPPEIRSIVDKTSQFVAKNGLEFENMIIANNERNAKFNFLHASHPYHAYYRHRLSESRVQNQSSVDASAKPEFQPVDKEVVEPPEADQYTVELPEGITEEEPDIIKLTAQFVARNGCSFFTDLTRSNPQFHFLRPTHNMFVFFTLLVGAYSKVLMPPEGLTEKLRNSVANMTTVLERCLHRLEWERSQEQARMKAEDEIEQERVQMAMIDWQDFVVVEIIDFADDEDEDLDLPPPMTLYEVIRRSKMSNMEEEDEDAIEPPMRILKLPAERDPTKYVVSPITGENIHISEMSEHVRISLIASKYKEQKERMFAKTKESTLAADDEICRNIVGLARTRPDIFGTTEEEVCNAIKSKIEKKKDEQPKQVKWDGHTENNQAMSQEINGAFNNDGRILRVNMVNTMLPPHSMQMAHMANLPPPPPLLDEPEPKRLKLDDSMLIPEDQFLAQHSGPTRIGIYVPNVDQGNLKGQVLEITVQSLSETVGSLKEKIAGQTQLPTNKQKLSGKAGFLKDNLSLAHYNVGPGETLSLSLRERGGRKRSMG